MAAGLATRAMAEKCGQPLSTCSMPSNVSGRCLVVGYLIRGRRRETKLCKDKKSAVVIEKGMGDVPILSPAHLLRMVESV